MCVCVLCRQGQTTQEKPTHLWPLFAMSLSHSIVNYCQMQIFPFDLRSHYSIKYFTQLSKRPHLFAMPYLCDNLYTVSINGSRMIKMERFHFNAMLWQKLIGSIQQARTLATVYTKPNAPFHSNESDSNHSFIYDGISISFVHVH